MGNAVFYSTAYPGSMSEKTDGSYVKRDDQESLAAAMLENFFKLQQEAQDWKSSACRLEDVIARTQAEVERWTECWRVVGEIGKFNIREDNKQLAVAAAYSLALSEIESLKAQLAECRDKVPEQAAKDLLIGINKGLVGKDLLIGINKGLVGDELLAFARHSLKGTKS